MRRKEVIVWKISSSASCYEPSDSESIVPAGGAYRWEEPEQSPWSVVIVIDKTMVL